MVMPLAVVGILLLVLVLLEISTFLRIKKGTTPHDREVTASRRRRSLFSRKAYDVFLSYKSQDATLARHLCEALTAAGLEPNPTPVLYHGRIPDDLSDPGYRTAAEALEEIGAHGDKIGVIFASETGPESGAALAKFLKSLKTKSVMANYDPANIVMRGFDPVQGAYDLAGLIAHTHAKDGISPGPKRGEVPLGEGEVPWPKYLRALKEIGYDGYLTIEREVGANPAADIATAVTFLKGQLAVL